jgi:hypothetical protein
MQAELFVNTLSGQDVAVFYNHFAERDFTGSLPYQSARTPDNSREYYTQFRLSNRQVLFQVRDDNGTLFELQNGPILQAGVQNQWNYHTSTPAGSWTLYFAWNGTDGVGAVSASVLVPARTPKPTSSPGAIRSQNPTPNPSPSPK